MPLYLEKPLGSFMVSNGFILGDGQSRFKEGLCEW